MADPIQIITPAELIAYPGAGSPTADDAQVYVELVNGIVNEAWKSPQEPVPYWVRVIALEAAARAARNPRGLQSWTRSLDDGSRTERLSDSAARAGVYLDPSDYRRLRGIKGRKNRFGTIRVDVGF